MWLTVVAIVTVIFLLLYKSVKKPPNYPPGPMGYPIVGNLFDCDPVFPRKTFSKWWEIYGDIFSIKFGEHNLIVVCDPEAIKKAFAGDDFLDRPKTFIFQYFVYYKNAGITTSWGSRWVDHRRFAMRHLKHYGLGKARSEDIILTEMMEIIERLKEKDGQEVELSGEFNCAVTNVIWCITSGNRMRQDSTKMQNFLKLSQSIFKQFADLALVDAFPWLRHVAPKKWINFDKFEDTMREFYEFFQEEVDRHRMTFNPSEEDRDLIDSYLRRFKEEENKPGYDKELEEFNLLAVLGDLFSAGGDTITTTLRWAFFYLIKYPHIQRKIQDLVNDVTGGNRMPRLSDRASMPYVEAFIMEVQRQANISPLGVPHSSTCDTTVMGYSIPKGTQLVPFFTACFQDPKYWENPEEFRPERFFDENGELKRPDALMPFSVGRRMCPGEQLAKSQLFLVTCCLLQQFDFSCVTGNHEDLCLEADNEAAVRYPKPYKMKIKSRKV